MRIQVFLALIFAFAIENAIAQKPSRHYLDPQVIEGEYVRLTVPLRDFVEPPFDGDIVKTEKLGYYPKSDWILNDSINPNAKPNGWDPVLQKVYPSSRDLKALNLNFDGMGYTNVNPPDPCIDVGPNHVIQMINGSGGSYFKIWDRNGTVIQGNTYFDSFTGIPGAGDPIVLYDQFADRWLMSEFSNTGNKLIVAISQTADPTGSWHVYSYTAPNFPDYPKYAIWDDAYIVTTNENSPAVYALDRNQMLNGVAGSAQRFTVSSYGTISFQALTPVDVDGSMAPPAGTHALVMRMADDAWDPNLNQDQLEIFEFDIDFNTPSNTSLSLVQTIATSPFDTHLCGYTSFACIPQQGSSVTLDPLRELLMNQINYRNFGSYEAMVMCHVTDVNGNDRAGIRWYELRRTTGNWSIHQEGTYSPDTESRWMPSIAINADGSIGLAYNVSSSSSYPSLKYTGRRSCDALNSMTEPEAFLGTGGGANGSNRYGDYASMTVDPVDGSFWFTGEYNPTSQWSTRISNFDFGSCQPTVSFTTPLVNADESLADVDNNCLDYKEYTVSIALSTAASADPQVTLSLSGNALSGQDYEPPSSLSATLTAGNLQADFIFRIYDDAYVETVENITINYSLNANGGNAVPGPANQTATIEITSDDLDPANIPGNSSSLLDEDFESNTLGSMSTQNPSGDTPFETATANNASSTYFNIPTPASGSYIAYVNDDACDCNQADVQLRSPVFSLVNSTAATLEFKYYYEDNAYQGSQEDADVLISTDGGTSFSLLEDLAASTNWTTKSINLAAYLGLPNLMLAIRYSDDGGWMYGLAIDDFEIVSTSSIGFQLLVNTLAPAEEYWGPNSTVHFFDPTSGKLICTLENTSAHDYGCTTVEVDRPGANPSALLFNFNDPAHFLASKTLKIEPANSNSTGTYVLSAYYEEAEITAWENITMNSRSVLELIKVAGDNHISDVTPANASNFTISDYPVSLSSFGNGQKLEATLNSGFSGFGIGKLYDGGGGCNPGVNTWTGPATGDWDSSPANWSMGVFPDYCHSVVIPTGAFVTVKNGVTAKAFTIDVQPGGRIEVKTGGVMDVIAPN